MTNKPTLLPVILAGGGGTRLWPMSREHYPKQFLALTGDDSLLQQTVKRLDLATDQASIDPPLILCNEEHRFLVAEQLRLIDADNSGIFLEPVGRNTAPALTIAALHAARGDGDPILFMMPADHVIRDLDAFHAAIARGMKEASTGSLVTFGIVPDRPETGYGYIRQGEALDGEGVNRIAEFVEKPDLETAEGYLAEGHHVWNSGMFMMRASVWLQAIEQHRPDILEAAGTAYGQASEDGDFLHLDQAAFSACPADSVDYAVMERIAGTDQPSAVIAMDAGWSDVGAWSSLWEIAEHDADGNMLRGDVCSIDSKDCAIVADHRFVAALGCEDLVVVETADAVMVAPRNKAQSVKQIVAWLKQQGRDERLTHRRVYRPWGNYESIDFGARFQVKRITVSPGERLSLQMHHHRAEHWIVVTGTARVTRNDETFLLGENESTYIPLGATHRLENPGTIPLEIIEIQSGAYLGEDDIVRFEDAYHRT